MKILIPFAVCTLFSALCSSLGWQAEGEGAAFAGRAFDPDAPAVAFDDQFAKGQTEATSALIAAAFAKPLEDS